MSNESLVIYSMNKVGRINQQKPPNFKCSGVFFYSDSIGSVRIRKLLSDNETIAPSVNGVSISFQIASRRDTTSPGRKSLKRKIITEGAFSPEKASK